jgi:hypothetical protein
VETQNNQLAKDKEEIEVAHNNAKTALDAERSKNQQDELSSSSLPEPSTSLETEHISEKQIVYEASSFGLPEQPMSPEIEPTSGDRTVDEVSSLSLLEQSTSPEPDPTSGDQAVALIQTLYQSLSNQNWFEAIDLYGPNLKFQFSPDFFRQFDQVTVENLKITSQKNSEINLVGETSYLYPDGTTQRGARSFIVTWTASTPLITDSAFIRVIKTRS